MLLLLLPLLSLAAAQPGAPWTEEEALAVKAKLYAMLDQPNTVSKEYLALHPELGLTTWPENKSKPSAPKLLRSTCQVAVENIYSNSIVLVPDLASISA